MSLKRVALLLAAYKLLIWMLIIASTYLYGDMDEGSYDINFHLPATDGPTYASHFATWDSAHYLHISESGYTPGTPTCAFYPLWPHWIQWSSHISGLSGLVSGIIWSNIFSVVGMVLFYALAKNTYGSSIANWSLAFLIAYPGSMFYLMNYTESMFFCGLMAMCYCMKERKYDAVVAVVAILLPLIRPVGILILIPMAWIAWKEKLWKQYGWMLTMPLLGKTAYCVWMYYMTGNPFEGWEAQEYWPTNSLMNMLDPAGLIASLLTPTAFHSHAGSALDRILFVLSVYAVIHLWKSDRQWFVWAIVLGILPAIFSSYVSYTRYSSIAYPLIFAWTKMLSRHPFSDWRWVILVWLWSLQMILIWKHINFRWAG